MKFPSYAVENVIKKVVEQATTVHRNHGKLVMNGRCPICGDSKKFKNKKRFWVHEDDEWYAITCYNCDARTNLTAFLSEYFPEELDHLKLLCFDQIKNGNVFKKKPQEKKKVKKPTNETHEFLMDWFETHCIKLSDPSNNEKFEKFRKFAIKKVKERNIKEKFWKDFYFCYKGDYKFRVIVPFFDDKGLVYFFQGRDIDPKSDENTLRYLTSSFDEIEFPDNKIYNFHRVVENKTVYICEGLLDSLFLKNSIALCNANVTGIASEWIRKKFSKRVWVLDNPEIDETGYERALTLLEDGETCFIMPSEHKDCKDLNDLALKLNVKEIDEEIIKDNLYTGAIGLMKVKVRFMGKWGENE